MKGLNCFTLFVCFCVIFLLVVGDVGYVDIIEDSHGKSKVKFWSLVSRTLLCTGKFWDRIYEIP